ncbi:zinc-binding dehydrogenase [Streptomyces sp. NPDC091215]|uniref:zinc-binding dehydrogenase n=1 Tax=Streptomyces sp. NPDC091215 TaxID=3155192 RepID=UPI00341EB145
MNGVAAVMTAPHTLDLREFPVPDPEPGGVVLNMIRANVCGTEVHIARGHHPLIKPGCVLGHEGIGRVSALGEGVTTDFAGQPLHEGDRVVAAYFSVCRRCPQCNRGDWSLCSNAYSRWSQPAERAPHFFGTFGTHWALGRDQYVYRVPDSVSSKAASSANCALSQMVNAMAAGKVSAGDRLLLLGAGGLGLCAAALGREAGAEVYVAEMAATRLPKAERFGAHHTVDLSLAADGEERIAMIRELTGGGADVVVDLTGVPSAFAEGVQMVRPAGRFVSVGSVSPKHYAQFDPGLFTRSGVTMQAILRYPPYMLSRAVNFLAATPHYPWEELVDADFTLAEASVAIQAAEDRKVTRAALIMNED